MERTIKFAQYEIDDLCDMLDNAGADKDSPEALELRNEISRRKAHGEFSSRILDKKFIVSYPSPWLFFIPYVFFLLYYLWYMAEYVDFYGANEKWTYALQLYDITEDRILALLCPLIFMYGLISGVSNISSSLDVNHDDLYVSKFWGLKKGRYQVSDVSKVKMHHSLFGIKSLKVFFKDGTTVKIMDSYFNFIQLHNYFKHHNRL